MKKIRAAIVGYGNIGKYVLEALEAAPDFEVAGIIRRNPNDIPDELKAYTVTDSITKLDKVDVAVWLLLHVAWKSMRKRFWL